MQCLPVESSTHALSLAPCPPPMFREFPEFHAFARKQNLTDCEINFVARKCNIKTPDVILTSSAVTNRPEPPYVIANVTDITARASAFTEIPVHVILIVTIILVCLMVIGVIVIVCILKRRRMGKQEKNKPEDSQAPEKHPLHQSEKSVSPTPLPTEPLLPGEPLLPSNGQKRPQSIIYPDGAELDDMLDYIDEEVDTMESPTVVKRRGNPRDLYIQSRTGSMVCNPDVLEYS